MIVCGTGIAPFIRDLMDVQERHVYNWPWDFGAALIKLIYFQEEVESFLKTGTLSKLSLAQSIDPDVPKHMSKMFSKMERPSFYPTNL